MIKIVNLTKAYGNQIVLKNVNLTFLDYGLVCILGPSGCGKSTLLNIIGGLIDDYQGKVTVNQYSLNKMNKKQLQLMRASEMAFIFQSHNLFKFDSVKQNIKLPLVMLNRYRNDFINRQVLFNLNRVALPAFSDKKALNLSGGEKQRVAIARALINNPSILLCDEPTASLDSKTGDNIFKLLKEQSKQRLVIVVTHSQVLAREYSDQIIEFVKDEVIQSEQIKKNCKIVKTKIKSKIQIPYVFFFRAAFMRLMHKKWRFIICNTLSTLGFITLGLSFILSSSLNNSLNQSITGLVGNNYIVATKKISSYHSNSPVYLGKTELEAIANNISGIDLNIGLIYEENLDSLMKHENKFVVLTNRVSVLLASLGLDAINRYTRLDNYESVYPNIDRNLAKDEVVLSFSKSDLIMTCHQLDIFPRTIERLGEYFLTNHSQLKFSVKNLDWQYQDEQILAIKGVKEGETTSLLHTDPYWNEWMIEECMRFKNTDNELNPRPWNLHKKYHIETKKEDFIEYTMKNQYFDRIYFIRDKKFLSRYHAIAKNITVFNISDVNKILKNDMNLGSYIFSSNASYLVLNESIGAGFVSDFLLTSSEALIDNSIDQNQRLKSGTTISYPNKVVLGNITNLNTDNLKFSSDLTNLSHGEEPRNIEEIVISSNLAKQLFNSEEQALGKTLHIAFLLTLESIKDEVIRTYQKSTIIISGVKPSNQNLIYQVPIWTIVYFNDYLGVDVFNNMIQSVAFSLDNENQVNESLIQLKNTHPDIKFTCPTLEIKTNIATTMTYVRYIFSIFSFIAMLIATILISLVTYLYVLENKHDARIILALGGSKKDVKKMFATQVILMMLFSTFTAVITLVGMTYMFNFNQASILPITLTLTFEPILAIIIVGFLITLLVIKASLPKSKMASIN